MTIDLWVLVATAALHFVLVMVAATPRLMKNGPIWGFGNRETPSQKVAEWARRAQCASDNLMENLPLAVILILVAHVSGEADSQTALGAEIFLGGRLVHAAVFIGGIPYLRTFIWSVSIVGLAMIAAALF